MTARIWLAVLLVPSLAFAGEQSFVPKIAPIAAPLVPGIEANIPEAPALETPGVSAVPELPVSAVLPQAAAVSAQPQAVSAQAPLSAVPAGSSARLPAAALTQLDTLGARLAPQGSAAPAPESSLNGAFDNLGPLSNGAFASAFRPATVYHLQQNEGGALGAEKRGHQDFRNEETPFPVPPELKDDVPSAQAANPAQWTGLISLHLHSVYSDGTLTPTQLIDEAYKQGVRIVSLTDHDSIAGIAEAAKRAKELGMTFIAGEEMTARGGVHVGALGLDLNNPDLIAHNERVRQARLVRAQGIIDHLNAQFRDNPSKDEERGLVLTIDEVKAHTKFDQGGTIEIPAIARVLLDHKLIEHVDDAYNAYLTDKIMTDPNAIPDPTVEQVLDVIHKAGGKAFLNHPYTVRGRTPQDKDDKVLAMLPGFDGIEAYRDSNAISDAGRDRFDQRTAKYLFWAKQHNILVGNGADYHGPDTHLNHLVVNMPKHYANDLLDGLGIPEAKSLIDGPAPNSVTPAAALLAAPLLAALPSLTLPHIVAALVIVGLLVAGYRFASSFADFLFDYQFGMATKALKDLTILLGVAAVGMLVMMPFLFR